MSLMWQKGKLFKLFFSDVQIQIMIENKIYCYYNVSLKWNISLFTNIPQQENIDIAINLIFSHNPNLNITKQRL